MDLPFDGSDLFLVAILPEICDLEIARMLGWYRIPLRSAPKLIKTNFTAFIQTSSFGEAHRWQVEFAAPVRGHESTTREHLFKDQPDHPCKDEEFFKISLGPLFPLPNPIPTGDWKRVPFLYATGDRILSAESLKELITRDRERDILCDALRERISFSGRYKVQTGEEMEIDPAILELLDGLGFSG
jgi:hypothetical protein